MNNNKELVVLSLFDGMGCGQIALNRAGKEIERYYAAEVDLHATKEVLTNFPDTRHLGDVRRINGNSLPQINLLMGGSPCQGFSSSGKGLNFNDPRSALFFEFVRLLDECKPDYFLLENVKMKKQHEQVISQYLGVEPIMINSSLVSAQNRVRLYWTNIPGIVLPVDRAIILSDVLGANRQSLRAASITGRRINEHGKRDDYNKNLAIRQCLEVRPNGATKSNCLTTVSKDNVLTSLPIGRYPDAFIKKLPFYYYSIEELCRLQTVPENYFKVSSPNQAKKMLGNGWTVDVIAHILSNL